MLVNDYLVKVIIVGDSGVGKTNMLTRFCDNFYRECYVATIGVDFKMKTVYVGDKSVKLQIWDTAGQQRFRNVTQAYYRGASGIMLVYSIDNSESFRNMYAWIKQIESNASENSCKILIGAKSDLQQERKVSYEEGTALAQRFNMPFFEVSAKTGSNITEAFMDMTKSIKMKKDTEQSVTNDKNSKLSARQASQSLIKRCEC